MTEKENPMAKIITKCWEDEEFKNRLMADPNAVLSAEGVVIPDGIAIKVVMDTKRVRHLIIPPRSLSDDDLQAMAAAKALPPGFCHSDIISCGQTLNGLMVHR